MKAKSIEFLVYAIFISGLFLWEELFFNWGFFRLNQLSHIFLSILLLCLFIGPFLIKHLHEHKRVILKKKKNYLRRKQVVLGTFLALSLVSILISGGYLFLVGNRGGDMYGEFSLYIHLYASCILVWLVVYHSYYLGRRAHKKHFKQLGVGK